MLRLRSTRTLALCLLAQLALAAGLPARASDETAQAGAGLDRHTHQPSPGAPLSPGSWLYRLMQAARKGQAMRHTHEIMAWLDALSEPRYMTALGTVTLDAGLGAHQRVMSLNPSAVHNWSEFTDPALYLRWRAEGANPGISRAIFNRWEDARGATAQGIEAPLPAVSSRSCLRMSAGRPDGPVSGTRGEWLRLPQRADVPRGAGYLTQLY